jgi:tetratricopeptide (TPR) repeat protein
VRETVVRAVGLLLAITGAVLIVWVYQRQPQTIAQVTGGLASSVGAYRVDQEAFEQGLTFFRNDQFEEARASLERADPAERDARTQFYIAYSYYRQGWGRVYSDDKLFAQGMEAVDRAIALSPRSGLRVEDPDLQMHTADELRAELQRGLTRDASDFNPLRLLGSRK